MKCSLNSIESFGTVDGPGIRTVVFLNGCFLRCKYCHNPETWQMQDKTFTSEELIAKVKRYKPYYKRNNGGITFSGGEPLLQKEYIIDVCKKLHDEHIHIALDTAGIGIPPYDEVLNYTDLIIYDIKDITEERYKDLTGGDIKKTWEFLETANRLNKKFWVRQVFVPGLNDNIEYITNLAKYIKEHIKVENIEKIEFLPYHKLGDTKYEKLGIPNPYKDKKAMDVEECNKWYQKFMEIYKKA